MSFLRGTTYVEDKNNRRNILTQLKRGESRHELARAIFHGKKGEIRKRYVQGQENQLSALGLVTNMGYFGIPDTCNWLLSICRTKE